MIDTSALRNHELAKHMPPLPRAEDLDEAILIEAGYVLHEMTTAGSQIAYICQCWNRLELGFCKKDATLIDEAFSDLEAFRSSCDRYDSRSRMGVAVVLAQEEAFWNRLRGEKTQGDDRRAVYRKLGELTSFALNKMDPEIVFVQGIIFQLLGQLAIFRAEDDALLPYTPLVASPREELHGSHEENHNLALIKVHESGDNKKSAVHLKARNGGKGGSEVVNRVRVKERLDTVIQRHVIEHSNIKAIDLLHPQTSVRAAAQARYIGKLMFEESIGEALTASSKKLLDSFTSNIGEKMTRV